MLILLLALIKRSDEPARVYFAAAVEFLVLDASIINIVYHMVAG